MDINAFKECHRRATNGLCVKVSQDNRPQIQSYLNRRVEGMVHLSDTGILIPMEGDYRAAEVGDYIVVDTDNRIRVMSEERFNKYYYISEH